MQGEGGRYQKKGISGGKLLKRRGTDVGCRATEEVGEEEEERRRE